MQDFKKLHVWQRAHALFLAVESALRSDRVRPVTGLRAQAIRAAGSIGANLAEGCGKATTLEFLRFINISQGSARELEYHLIVARDLEVITQPQFEALDESLGEVRRMLAGLTRAFKRQTPRAAAPGSVR